MDRAGISLHRSIPTFHTEPEELLTGDLRQRAYAVKTQTQNRHSLVIESHRAPAPSKGFPLQPEVRSHLSAQGAPDARIQNIDCAWPHRARTPQDDDSDTSNEEGDRENPSRRTGLEVPCFSLHRKKYLSARKESSANITVTVDQTMP